MFFFVRLEYNFSVFFGQLLASQNWIQKFFEGSVTLHTDALCAFNEAVSTIPDKLTL